jgi:hypothetical protein
MTDRLPGLLAGLGRPLWFGLVNAGPALEEWRGDMELLRADYAGVNDKKARLAWYVFGTRRPRRPVMGGVTMAPADAGRMMASVLRDAPAGGVLLSEGWAAALAERW